MDPGHQAQPTLGGEPQEGRLAELAFLQEGLRQNQRERQVFLGFAITATATLLGLLLHGHPDPSRSESFILVALTGLIIVVAEFLTIRSTIGVRSGAAYIRLFIEPHIPGTGYETRLATFAKKSPRLTGAALGLGVAYAALASAPPYAWFEIAQHRTATLTAIVLLIAVAALALALDLVFGWLSASDKATTTWEAIAAAEGAEDSAT